MKRYPLVSIIVPNYNHARYIKKRMESIFSQTYDNYEVIILDDCSTDNSMEMIEQCAKNAHVSHIVRNEANSGSPFRQWEKGIGLAKGEIVWIAESDDYCATDMLARLVEAYVSHDCTLAFARSVAVDEEGNDMYVCQRMFKKDYHWRGSTFIRRYLNTGNRIYNASSAIFSKEAALHANRSFMNYKESGDWLFWIEIARQGNVAVVAEPMNFFRRSATTQTSKATLSGEVDIEDMQVIGYLKAEGLASPYHIFVKKKRMAKRLLYDKGRYASAETRQHVADVCHLGNIYFLLARLSHLFHYIKK